MRDEEGIIIRPVIPLVSPNEIARWWWATWFGLITALGILALAAFAIPAATQRVNDAHQEQING